LQKENRHLRELVAAKGQRLQQQQEKEETFIAIGILKERNNVIPIRVTVNVRAKSIEFMEVAHDAIEGYY
jgi:hypothetical protein